MVVADVLKGFSEVRAAMRHDINTGRNVQAVTSARKLLESADLAIAPAAAVRAILSEEARAWRNLGNIDKALACYTGALKSAYEEGHTNDSAWQLLLLGKFFGKYLNRPVFFHVCLEEVRRQWESPSAGLEDDQTKRRAVLFDLIGSYYRRLADQDETHLAAAEEAYEKASDLHGHCGNADGVSRAQCHLAVVRAMRAARIRDRAVRTHELSEALDSFEKGLAYVLAEPAAVRGRATRFAQRAFLYFQLEQTELAQQFVEVGMRYARQTSDSRGLIETAKIKARIMRYLGKTDEAVTALVEARDAAARNSLFGLQRVVNALLIDCYLEMNQRAKALPLLEENDRLTQEDILRDVHSREVLELFRKVAPRHADRYLFEGLQREMSALVLEMLNNERRLRAVLSAFDRVQSKELQHAVMRFARAYVIHDIGSKLAVLAMDLRGIAVDVNDRAQVYDELQALAKRAETFTTVINDEEDDEDNEETSLIDILAEVASDILGPENVRIECSTDALFFNLRPVLMKETLTHLIENVHSAVRTYAPTPGTPHLVVTQQKRDDGGWEFRLCNPGANPEKGPVVRDGKLPQHGFENAVLLLTFLKIGCTFSLSKTGPASPGRLSNCITLSVPPSTAGHLHRFVPRVRRS